MYKVFYLSKEIIFTKNTKNIVFAGSDVMVVVQGTESLNVEYQNYIIENAAGKLIFVCGEKIEQVFEYFMTMFIKIEAAGGMVINKNQKLLMIYRLGKWDLPKGKIEVGESPEVAALREVNEETGMNSLSVIRNLEPTYHIYYVSNRKYLKKTYWFEMLCEDTKIPTPQLIEGITMVEWLDKDGVQMAMKNTYDSLRGLLTLYLAK